MNVLYRDKVVSATFSRIFTDDDGQEDVYRYIGKCVDKLMDGKSVSILAYGNTGSGKTYTIYGGDWTDTQYSGKEHNRNKKKRSDQKSDAQGSFLDSLEKDPESWGLLPRLADRMFNMIEEGRSSVLEGRENNPNVEVSIKYYQIYNEKILDMIVVFFIHIA